MGHCVWKRGRAFVRRVTLSQHYAMLNGLEHRDESGLAIIEDVIRHEIAHAVDYEMRGRSVHDAPWKAICRRVGADPSRLYEGEKVSLAPGKYVATCSGCGVETDYYRRPKRARACRACCQTKSGGRFDARFKLTLRERRTGRRVAYIEEQHRKVNRQEPASSSLPAEPASPAERGYKYTGTCPECSWVRGYRRRLKRMHACPQCCRQHAGGQYHEDYRLRITQNY